MNSVRPFVLISSWCGGVKVAKNEIHGMVRLTRHVERQNRAIYSSSSSYRPGHRIPRQEWSLKAVCPRMPGWESSCELAARIVFIKLSVSLSCIMEVKWLWDRGHRLVDHRASKAWHQMEMGCVRVNVRYQQLAVLSNIAPSMLGVNGRPGEWWHYCAILSSIALECLAWMKTTCVLTLVCIPVNHLLGV